MLKSIIGGSGDYASQGILQEKGALDTKAVLTAIGIYVRDLSDSEKSEGLRGVVVSKIDKESTLQEGIQVGDIIRAINGNYPMSSTEFLVQLAESAMVQDTELFVIRGKSRRRVTISKVQ